MTNQCIHNAKTAYLNRQLTFEFIIRMQIVGNNFPIIEMNWIILSLFKNKVIDIDDPP